MVAVAIMRTKDWDYALERDFEQRDKWFFSRANGRKFERFSLDYDKRHQRLFLTEQDQRRVGVKGIVALEKLTRSVLDR